MLLNTQEFANFVSNGPLISIDICIQKKRKILLGKRKNSPAKNFYFVPGGRIIKDEKIDDAIVRLLISEIGYKFKKNNIKNRKFIGFFEHFYKDNFQGNTKYGTHYVVLSFLIDHNNIEKMVNVNKNTEQHSKYIWYCLDKKEPENLKIHKYALDYIKELQ